MRTEGEEEQPPQQQQGGAADLDDPRRIDASSADAVVLVTDASSLHHQQPTAGDGADTNTSRSVCSLKACSMEQAQQKRSEGGSLAALACGGASSVGEGGVAEEGEGGKGEEEGKGEHQQQGVAAVLTRNDSEPSLTSFTERTKALSRTSSEPTLVPLVTTSFRTRVKQLGRARGGGGGEEGSGTSAFRRLGRRIEAASTRDEQESFASRGQDVTPLPE